MQRSRHGFVLLVALGLALCAAPSSAREAVEYSGGERPGTVVVQTGKRQLIYVVAKGKAMRYSVGVGRSDKQWFGTTVVVAKHIKPAWSPPAMIRRGRPNWVVPGGTPQNPMGAAALVLADSELAIHGTNNPGSIGGFVSWGCIRMHNRDIMDLYGRVKVGTRVVFAR